MVIFGITLLMLSGHVRSLEPIQDRPQLKTGAGFYGDHIAALTPHAFYVWHRDGHLLAYLQGKDNEHFTAWTLTHAGLLISFSSEDDHMASRLYDKQSLQPIHEINFFSTRYQTVRERLYAFPVKATANHVPPGSPYLFEPIILVPSRAGYEVNTLEPTIAKAQPALINRNLAYKDAWLVPYQQGFLVMNTLEAKIYHYPPFLLNMEQREGIRVPSKLKGQPIDLTAFKPMPEKLESPSGIFPVGTIQKLFWNYDEGHSRVLGFHPFRNGYLVAYTIPDCPDQALCQESLLGLQWINRDLQIIGDTKVSSGMLIGIRDNSVYLLQFERPLKMQLPPPPYRPLLRVINDW